MKILSLKIIIIFISTFPFFELSGQIKQEKSSWCWAACFQHFVPFKTQCEIVNIALSRTPNCSKSCTDPTCSISDSCNYAFIYFSNERTIDPVKCLGGANYFFSNVRTIDGTTFSCQEHYDSPTWETLSQKLPNEDIILLIESAAYNTEANDITQTGHFVVVTDAFYDKCGVKKLRIMDPWPKNTGRVFIADYLESRESFCYQGGIITSGFNNYQTSDNSGICFYIDSIQPVLYTKAPTNNNYYPNINLCYSKTKNNLFELGDMKLINRFLEEKCKFNNCNFNKSELLKIYTSDILKNEFKPSKPNFVYQINNEIGHQYLLNRKRAGLRSYYYEKNKISQKINPFPFYRLSREYLNFSYLSEHQQKGSPFESIEINFEGKRIIIGNRKAQINFKIVEYDFLQTWFYTFHYKGKDYVFFENQQSHQLVKNTHFDSYKAYPLQTVIDSLKKQTEIDIKYFNTIPKGAFYSR